jgi:CRP-like cAMP-binding protein
MNVLLLNFGYVLMLSALVMRDVLWLRMTMVLAQSVLGLYAWTLGLTNNVAWNAVFITINVVWTIRILRERRAVTLPEHLKPLYERHFFSLTRGEFLKWWKLGRRETLRDERMTSNGESPRSLYFVLDGTACVTRNDQHVVDLTAGQFVAEMSLLTGRPANADVFAVGTIDVMRWNVDELKELRESDPAMWARIQSAIGQDLVAKIQRIESHAVTQAPGAMLRAAV